MSFSVPFDPRGWSRLDRRWRDGLLAGLRLATPGAVRVLGHGGVLLESDGAP